jgi:hypothetical protein
MPSTQSKESSEHFRRWVMATMSMPFVGQDLHAGIVGFEPEDVPEMVEIVREAEMTCMQQLQECNRRTRPAGEAADTDGWARTVELFGRHRELMEWDTRIRWLQDVRRHLENERQRSEIACA